MKFQKMNILWIFVVLFEKNELVIVEGVVALLLKMDKLLLLVLLMLLNEVKNVMKLDIKCGLLLKILEKQLNIV
jgi:hypothetical protein